MSNELRIQGLVPHLPSNQPRAQPRWWCADGFVDADGLVTIESLDERESAPPVTARCGIAAPCSLPAPAIEFLSCGSTRAEQLAELARWTPNRLFSRIRKFAREQQRGKKHPRRAPHESHSALDRRRLARFHAAIPILASDAGLLFEVDVPAWLSSLALPPHQLAGDDPKSIARRTSIVKALEEGRAGLRLVLPERVYAHASLPALEAVVSAFAAAWVLRNAPEHSGGDTEAWIPIP